MERQDTMPNKDGQKLWRPEIVRNGKMVDIKVLSKMLSTATTLTYPDVVAVLHSLSRFMGLYLREGYCVRLNGVGTYIVYGRSKGNGVRNKEDVHPSQFNSLVIKFTPEYTVSADGKRERTLLNDVEFTHINSLCRSYHKNLLKQAEMKK